MSEKVQYIFNREISKPLIGQKRAADQEQIGQKRKAGGKTRAFEDQFQNAKRARVEREMEDIEYVNRFKLTLALFQSSCSFCMLHGKQVTSHSIVRCPTLGPRISDYKQWKGTLKIGGKGSATSCYLCHVPQCNDQLYPAFSRPENCQYPDIVASIAFGIFFMQNLCTQDIFKHGGQHCIHFQNGLVDLWYLWLKPISLHSFCGMLILRTMFDIYLLYIY